MSIYTRTINGVELDVYDILVAYDVRCPATAHAIKKLLMAGQRGSKSRRQDLMEAKEDIYRAVNLEEQWSAGREDAAAGSRA